MNILTSDGKHVYGPNGVEPWRQRKFNHASVGYVGWILVQDHVLVDVKSDRPRLSHLLYKLMGDSKIQDVVDQVYRFGYAIWGWQLMTDCSVLAITHQGRVDHIQFGGEQAWVRTLTDFMWVVGDRGITQWLDERGLASADAPMVARHLNRLRKWYSPAPDKEIFKLEQYEASPLLDQHLFDVKINMERELLYRHMCQLLWREGDVEPFR